MKLISILFAGAAKTTTGIVATVAAAATVITAATVVHSPALPVEEVQSAPSVYMENLPEKTSKNGAQDIIEDTDRTQAQEPAESETQQSDPEPQVQKQASKADAIASAPVQSVPASAPESPTQTSQMASGADMNSTPPQKEVSEDPAQTILKNTDQAQAPTPAEPKVQQPQQTIPQPDPKPQVQEQAPKVDAAATVPVQPAPEPAPAPQPEPASQPEQKPAYEFSYHHTTSIYENDGTLIRVEYYDDNNKLTHYSKVEDHDPETNSYTENIYTYDEETETEILQRTDTYTGSTQDEA